MRGYLTPNSIPAGITCRVLFIPDDRDWIAQVYGALEVLTFPDAWTEYGAVTPNEAAEEYRKMWYKLLDNERGCRMVGEIILWGGSSVPSDSDLLLCDGASVSNVDYPALWGIIGLTYGGTSATDFFLPDLRGKVAIGANGSHTLATTGGAETVTLGVGEMPSHTHTDVGHTHVDGNAIASLAEVPVVPAPSAVPGIGTTGSGAANLTNSGGGGAHENMQPFLTLNYYIQAA